MEVAVFSGPLRTPSSYATLTAPLSETVVHNVQVAVSLFPSLSSLEESVQGQRRRSFLKITIKLREDWSTKSPPSSGISFFKARDPLLGPFFFFVGSKDTAPRL